MIISKVAFIASLLGLIFVISFVCIKGITTQSQAATSFTFAAQGDYGTGYDPDTLFTKMSTLGLNFVIALGDLSYTTVGQENNWCNNVKSKMGANYPFELIAGNHEDDSKDDGWIDTFAQCLPDHLGAKGSYAKQYYFDYPSTSPLARFILISPNLTVNGAPNNFTVGSSYYNWLSQTIDEARAAGIQWIIVGSHEDCLSIGRKTCEVGTDLMNLIISKKVDLWLQGHDHMYERSKQLKCAYADHYDSSCIVDDGSDNSYTKNAGTIIVGAGTGGNYIYDQYPAQAPLQNYMAAYMMTTGSNPPCGGCQQHGIMKYAVSDSQITAQFIPTSRNYGTKDYTDSFIITSNGSTIAPPTTQPAVATPTKIVPPTSTPTSVCPVLPTDTGNITIPVTVGSTGTYTIWSRIKTLDTTNNSYWLQIDNTCGIIVGDSATIAPNTWTWVNYRDGNPSAPIAINLSQGNHTVRLIAREGSIGIDRLLFLPDAACKPTGVGDNCTVSPTNTPGITVLPTATKVPVTLMPSSIKTPTPEAKNIVCSSTTDKQCSYTDQCSQEGQLCEKNVTCGANNKSSNNVYVCHNGKWTYNHWVEEGTCKFCSGKVTTPKPKPSASKK